MKEKGFIQSGKEGYQEHREEGIRQAMGIDFLRTEGSAPGVPPYWFNKYGRKR